MLSDRYVFIHITNFNWAHINWKQKSPIIKLSHSVVIKQSYKVLLNVNVLYTVTVLVIVQQWCYSRTKTCTTVISPAIHLPNVFRICKTSSVMTTFNEMCPSPLPPTAWWPESVQGKNNQDQASSLIGWFGWQTCAFLQLSNNFIACWNFSW